MMNTATMRHRWLIALVVVVMVAAAFGSWSAVRLDKTYGTCEEVAEIIKQQNIRGEVLKRLLMNAADAREASARLPGTSPAQRKINRRAASLYRKDVVLIKPTNGLKC